MSPILVRPVREQLEHDRIIRLLQPRYRRRFNVGINPGNETAAPVGAGPEAIYPDLVLMPTGRSKKLAGVVEVETGESVNALEAMAQWAIFGRLPAEFALYVPAGSVEVAKRLCLDNNIGVTEIWTYHMIGDQTRFTQVLKSPIEAKLSAARAAAAAAAPGRNGASRKPAKSRPAKTIRRPPAAPRVRPKAKEPASSAGTRHSSSASRSPRKGR
ncbi:MAG: hypothetical protein NTV05_08070 [Acidobacteria bacterium]|nr:hypothetical protein [Acidobacteriota bacterium]